MTKLYNKYDKMLKERNYLTEIEIVSLKSRISTNHCTLTKNEVQDLKGRTYYNNCEYNITKEHSQKGIEYLKSKCFRKDSKRRNTKQLQSMPKEFFLAIENYDHFTFVGFIDLDFNVYCYRTFYMPVWRIHTKNGEYFDYYMDLNLNFDYTGEYNIKTHLQLVG